MRLAFGLTVMFTVLIRWAQSGQTDQESAPQTAASHGLGSDHGEEASHHVHATTVAIHHPEAEDGPSGELTCHTAPSCIVLHQQLTLTTKATERCLLHFQHPC